jgi:hypothetical protein
MATYPSSDNKENKLIQGIPVKYRFHGLLTSQ